MATACMSPLLKIRAERDQMSAIERRIADFILAERAPAARLLLAAACERAENQPVERGEVQPETRL